MENGIEKRDEQVATVRDLLNRSRVQITNALPKHLDADRFLRVAMTALQRTPKLLDCTPVSFLAALIQAAQLGLEPDGVTGQAFLIPRRNNKAGTVEVNFQPGYQGLMLLARRSGDISNIIPRCVYEKDKFSSSYGLGEDLLEHVPFDGPNPGPIVKVYCIVRLTNGSAQFEVWSRAKVDAHRERFSRAGEDGPWATDYDKMAMKTLIVQALKYAPKSVELQKAIALEEMAQSGIPQELGAAFEIVPQLTQDSPVAALPSGGSQLDKVAMGHIRSEKAEKAEKEATTLADKQRKELRKGRLSDKQLGELEQAKAQAKLTSKVYTDILGIEGYERQEEVKAKDFKKIMARVREAARARDEAGTK